MLSFPSPSSKRSRLSLQAKQHILNELLPPQIPITYTHKQPQRQEAEEEQEDEEDDDDDDEEDSDQDEVIPSSSSSSTLPSSSSSPFLSDVRTDDEAFDISFHPSAPLFAAGLITGALQLYTLDWKKPTDKRHTRAGTMHTQRPTPQKQRQPRKQHEDDEEEEDLPAGGPVVVEDEELISDEADAAADEDDNDEVVLLDPNLYAPPSLLHQSFPHTSSIRSLSFSADGQSLYTASSDQSIAVFAVTPSAIQALTLLNTIPSAHSTAINVLKPFSESHPHLLVTGDDDGYVKVWDLRMFNKGNKTNEAAGTTDRERVQRSSHHHKQQKKKKRQHVSPKRAEQRANVSSGSTAIMSFAESGDYISDIAIESVEMKVLTTSGDGHLQVFDLRRHGSWYAQSDRIEDDLLSCVILHKNKAKAGQDNRKVIVGTKEHGLHVFSWGLFGIADEHVSFSTSADVLCEIPSPSNHNLLSIASSEGTVSLCALWPHSLLTVIGCHHQHQPIESMVLSPPLTVPEHHSQQRWLLSAGHDKRIKFWNMTQVCEQGWTLPHEQQAEDEEDEEHDVDESDSATPQRVTSQLVGATQDKGEDAAKDSSNASKHQAKRQLKRRQQPPSKQKKPKQFAGGFFDGL